MRGPGEEERSLLWVRKVVFRRIVELSEERPCVLVTELISFSTDLINSCTTFYDTRQCVCRLLPKECHDISTGTRVDRPVGLYHATKFLQPYKLFLSGW
jgi:hypothetical protein